MFRACSKNFVPIDMLNQPFFWITGCATFWRVALSGRWSSESVQSPKTTTSPTSSSCRRTRTARTSMASCCSCSFLVIFCCDHRCHTCIFLTPYFQYPILIFLDAKRTMTAFTTSGCPSITTRRHSIAICTSEFQFPPKKNKYGKYLDFFCFTGPATAAG